MKKSVQFSIEYGVWKAYKKLCFDIGEHASNRIEKFMERELRKKRKQERGNK